MSSQFTVLLLSLVETALLIAAIATPLWVYMEESGEHIGIGLFYRSGLKDAELLNVPTSFKKIKITSDETIDTRHWHAVAAFEVIATVFAAFEMLLLYNYISKLNLQLNVDSLYNYVFWLSVAAWLFNGLGLVIFIIYHGDILTEGPDINSDSFCWSGLMCFFAGACGVIITYIIRVYLRPGKQGRKNNMQMALNGIPGWPSSSGMRLPRPARSLPPHRMGFDDNLDSRLQQHRDRLDVLSAGDLYERRFQPRDMGLGRSLSPRKLFDDDLPRNPLALGGLANGDLAGGLRNVNDRLADGISRRNENIMLLERRQKDNMLADFVDEDLYPNRISNDISQTNLGGLTSRGLGLSVY